MTAFSQAFETARDYAEHGLPVFPCHTVTDGVCTCGKGATCASPGKHPRTSNGLKNATTDERQLLNWNTQWPDANWAARQGSGRAVIDIDPKSGGDPREVIDTFGLDGPIVWTGEATTGRLMGTRGAHVYVAADVRSGGTAVLGVEIRGAGGYTMLPGSRHASGLSYEWADDRRPWTSILPAIPDDLRPAARPTAPVAPAESAIPDGQRNAELTSMAGVMRRRGFAEDAILAALAVTNETRCHPPLDDAEVSTIAGSVSRYPPAPAGATVPPTDLAPLLRRLDVAEMLQTDPPPIPWLVEPLLIPGELTMLTGREGRGKSMLSQALAVALADPAVGGDVLGMPVNVGKVVVIDAENGVNEIHRRLHGAGLTDATRYLTFEAAGLRLQDVEHLAHLHEIIKRERPAVVVLDSLVSLAPGVKENDVGPVQVLLQGVQGIARDTGAAILLLHHAGKGDSGQEYRGSSAIGGVVTLGVTMTAHEGDPDQARRELRWWKCRPCAKPAPIWLRISGDDGRLRLTVTDPFEAAESGAPARDGLASQILQTLHEDGPATSKADLARRVGTTRDHDTFKRAVAELIGDGEVVQDGRRLSLPDVATSVATATTPATLDDSDCGVAGGTPGATTATPQTAPAPTEGVFGYDGDDA